MANQWLWSIAPDGQGVGNAGIEASIRLRRKICHIVEGIGVFIGPFPLLIAVGDLLGGQTARFSACGATVYPAIDMPPIVGFPLGTAQAANLLTLGFFKPQVMLVALRPATFTTAVVPLARYLLGDAAYGASMLASIHGFHPLVAFVAGLPTTGAATTLIVMPKQLTDQSHGKSPLVIVYEWNLR